MQSQPANHIKDHSDHSFSWDVSLATAYSWLKRRIIQAFYIARLHPEVNKQVQWSQLILFSMGIGVT